jgi:signal transduction histidine kinase
VIDPCLQDTSHRGPVSPDAAVLAATILAGEITLDESIERVAAHLLQDSRIEVVAAALTSFTPEDQAAWARLGGRAWVREWSDSVSTISILPPPGAGAEAALSMPWLSQFARAGMAVLIDRDHLPAEASRDREELARIGVRSLVGTAFLSKGDMFGSFSAGSGRAGRFPEELIDDLRLLNATISSRITLEHSRRALAEAMDAGAEAHMAFQEFFGAVGHELRTPLASVLGYTEVLLDDAQHGTPELVSSGMLRDGPLIVRACEQLLSVVDSLLGAGRTLSSDEQKQDLVLADVIADVVHWHANPARAARVEIHVSVDPGATAWGHASGVRQILTNLLGNAIAHHHTEGGSVHVSTARLLGESGQPMVRIIVRDDGPGLAADQIQHVFEPFVRYARPTTKGSGLGLSIARTIAERDGGAVRGESTQGVGSSFWLELPVRSS